MKPRTEGRIMEEIKIIQYEIDNCGDYVKLIVLCDRLRAAYTVLYHESLLAEAVELLECLEDMADPVIKGAIKPFLKKVESS